MLYKLILTRSAFVKYQKQSIFLCFTRR